MRLKEQKRQKPTPTQRRILHTQRTAAKWLIGLMNDLDWGRKKFITETGTIEPRPVNCGEVVSGFLKGTSYYYPRRPSQIALMEHFQGKETCYFTGSRGDLTLLNLDIDCKKEGSRQGAFAFAEYLKKHFFPNLYHEVSTHGNGGHGYILIDKSICNDHDYNLVLKRLEKWLRDIVQTTDFDVENIEIKGTCPEVSWGQEYRRQLLNYKFGFLAKLPREWERFEEWKATTKLTVEELAAIIEKNPMAVAEVVKAAKASGSVFGKLIDPKRIEELMPLAAQFVPQPICVNRKARVWVTAYDAAVFLALHEYFTKNPLPENANPVARWQGLWQAMFKCGDITRAFDPKRFAFLRNLISDAGGVEWIDRKYIPGSKGEGIKGKCCKWKASDDMMDCMAEYTAQTVVSCDSNTISNRSSIDFRSKTETIEVIRPERVMANLECLLRKWEYEDLERIMRPPKLQMAA
jgi:hypothetical protein